jgi:hypothetical protein
MLFEPKSTWCGGADDITDDFVVTEAAALVMPMGQPRPVLARKRNTVLVGSGLGATVAVA